MNKNSVEYIRKIKNRRSVLQNPYAFLNDLGEFDAIETTNNESKNKTAYSRNLTNHSPISFTLIEREARRLQLKIWEKRHELWPRGVPSDPIDLLDPQIAAKCLGYKFDTPEYIGEYLTRRSKGDIAGVIDRELKQISISQRLPFNTLRFTAAHELGHALLHSQTMLHRDRPVDGSIKTGESREPMELEADKFASYFLMPEKLLRKRFHQVFGVKVFELNDDSAFALKENDAVELIDKCKTCRDLSRILASTTRYNGRHVKSLAQQFHVSIEAMSIRIEDLKLVSFGSTNKQNHI